MGTASIKVLHYHYHDHDVVVVVVAADVEEDGMSVSVLLDGEESMMEFIDEEQVRQG